MCGICGAIDLTYTNRIYQNVIGDMMTRIGYRGPDSQGVYANSNIAMGFVRLAIVGLENGDQPLKNENNTICLICNGEIFNYVELKNELVKKGHIFRSDTDVEVIIHLYEEYGDLFVDELNGQFAFVLVDEKNRRVICARDHFGICPLYYTIKNDMLIFASEIKSILCYPGVEKRIDLTGLDQVLTFPGLISPRTMFEGVKSLENGHCLVIHENTVNDVEYWDLQYPEETEIAPLRNESSYFEELFALLEESISLRLRSDVPVGAYLSGGLDSSFIASMASRINGDRKLKTFSIAFPNDLKSEAYYQRLMARELNSEHHEILFDGEDIIKRLRQTVYHCECPLKETYNTANFALSECVRNNGVKVVMSGEGSDELFAGYIGYKFDKFRQQTHPEGESSGRALSRQRAIWGDPYFIYERDLDLYTKLKLRLFSNSVKEIYEQVDCCNSHIINKNRIENKHIIHKRAYIDYKLRLVDHLVSDHGDKMSLANSVEVRYPFLDKKLFEFVTRLPPDLLLREYEEKYIIKKCIAHKGALPKEIIDREKFEFSSLGSNALLQRNNPIVRDILDYDRIKMQGVFDPEYVLDLKKKYSAQDFKLNIPHENDLLLIVITFGLLLEMFDIQKVI